MHPQYFRVQVDDVTCASRIAGKAFHVKIKTKVGLWPVLPLDYLSKSVILIILCIFCLYWKNIGNLHHYDKHLPLKSLVLCTWLAEGPVMEIITPLIILLCHHSPVSWEIWLVGEGGGSCTGFCTVHEVSSVNWKPKVDMKNVKVWSPRSPTRIQYCDVMVSEIIWIHDAEFMHWLHYALFCACPHLQIRPVLLVKVWKPHHILVDLSTYTPKQK